MSLWIASRWKRENQVGASSSRKLKRSQQQRRLDCELLEDRELLTVGGVNVDYTLMGGQWDNSKPITFSVAPDGVAWDQGTNNLSAKLDAEFPGSDWRSTIAVALQTWAASANLNFTPVADGPFDFNTIGQSQGDPRFGDIRVAGYAFPNTTIAQTYGPPPNGSTAAGDVKLNTTYNFGPNGQWDLETVLIHELGHSLGLGESPQVDSAMYSYYGGVRHSLSSADIEGIQSIYGPRLADVYQAAGQATTGNTAVDLAGAFHGSTSAVLNGLSLSAIGDSEYFSITAPATQGATLRISAIANEHSLMSPKVTVIDPATGATRAVDAHPDQYGDTASVAIPDAQPGHRYLIVVSGATSDVFAVGNYSLQATFSGGTPAVSAPTSPTVPVVTPPTLNPTPTTPITTTPVTTGPVTTPTVPTPVSPTDPYAGNTSFGTAAELGSITGLSTIHNVVLPTGQDIRVFAFEPASAGLVFLASANDTLIVGDSNGRLVTSGRGLIGFQASQAGARYYLIVVAPNQAPVTDASFAIQVVPMAITLPTTGAATTSTIGPPSVPIVQAASPGASTPRTTKARKRHR